MIEIKEPVDGECTVVEADALTEMTKWEWKLLMVLPERVQTNKEETKTGAWATPEEMLTGTYSEHTRLWLPTLQWRGRL